MKTYKKCLYNVGLKLTKTEYPMFQVTSSKDIYQFIKEYIIPEAGDDIELFETVHIVFLNSANNTIGHNAFNVGSMRHSMIDVRRIAMSALISNASAIIMLHNHPSGQMEFSDEDKSSTKHLKKSMELLGMHLLDSIVFSSTEYISFADEGEL